ncbi:hypothetical protein K7X08_015958 [Anisodus acutangulus]|uniref:Uncharacterized protein n=1 Tax=Anisodus acutangulus TaxID=402998 RepID=A0A9Q1LEM7_9SOLA|nr:hypothetical protein K7X08_015958 [Anisodus acutangulus]
MLLYSVLGCPRVYMILSSGSLVGLPVVLCWLVVTPQEADTFGGKGSLVGLPTLAYIVIAALCCRISDSLAMPPKKAIAAQKGKPTAGDTSRIQRVTRSRTQCMPKTVPQSASSASSPPPEAPVHGATSPVSEAPAPEPPALQSGAEDKAMIDAV